MQRLQAHRTRLCQVDSGLPHPRHRRTAPFRTRGRGRGPSEAAGGPLRLRPRPRPSAGPLPRRDLRRPDPAAGQGGSHTEGTLTRLLRPPGCLLPSSLAPSWAGGHGPRVPRWVGRSSGRLTAQPGAGGARGARLQGQALHPDLAGWSSRHAEARVSEGSGPELRGQRAGPAQGGAGLQRVRTPTRPSHSGATATEARPPHCPSRLATGVWPAARRCHSEELPSSSRRCHLRWAGSTAATWCGQPPVCPAGWPPGGPGWGADGPVSPAAPARLWNPRTGTGQAFPAAAPPRSETAGLSRGRGRRPIRSG